MTLTESLLCGIAASLIVWLTTCVLRFVVKKSRVQTALLTDINYHRLGVAESAAFLEHFMERRVRRGSVLDEPFFFAMNEYELYRALQHDMAHYLSRRELVRVIKFYKAFWELENLLEAFFRTLETYRTGELPLSEANVNFLSRKTERICSLSRIVGQGEIKRLRDLPEDYRGRQDAKASIGERTSESERAGGKGGASPV